MVAISTVDDPALYCKTPEVAHRLYGGLLGKTLYYKELAARLILAAVARYEMFSCLGNSAVSNIILIFVGQLQGPIKESRFCGRTASKLTCQSWCK
jgi:hypothetical protein